MGAWGFLLFQSDAHLDAAGDLTAEAGVGSLYFPDDPDEVKRELEGAVLDGLFDRFKKQRPQPKEDIAILGALAMQLGASIRPEDLALIGRCAKRAQDFLMEGADQLKIAVKAYKNDGTAYEFDSPGLMETAMMGTPYPPGHPMHAKTKYFHEEAGGDAQENAGGLAGEGSGGEDEVPDGKAALGRHGASN